MLDDYSFFLKLISENGNFLELLNKEEFEQKKAELMKKI